MDIKEIEKEIEKLENEKESYKTVSALADMYIVRKYLNKKNTAETYSEQNTENDAETEFMTDVLPAYKRYKEVKRKYQLGNTTKEKVLLCMDKLTKEIKELIQIMYTNSDMPEERNKISEFIEDLNVGNI